MLVHILYCDLTNNGHRTATDVENREAAFDKIAPCVTCVPKELAQIERHSLVWSDEGRI